MTATVVPAVVVTGALAVLLVLFLCLAQHITTIQMTHGRPHRNIAAITTPVMIPVTLEVVRGLVVPVEMVMDSGGSVPV